MPSTFAALEARNYRLYWFGLVCYVLGHRAEYVTFAWLAWALTHDPLYLGYLGLAQGVPLVVFQLWGGVLADRMDRLRLLIVTQLLTARHADLAFGLAVAGDMRVGTSWRWPRSATSSARSTSRAAWRSSPS